VLPGSALAGNVIELKTEVFGRKSPRGTAIVYLDGDRVRIDSNAGAGDVTVIYNRQAGDSGTFWLIDNESRVYTEIAREDMLQAKAEMQAAIATAKQELEQMPPDQRKAATRMFAERVGGALMDEDITYTQVSSGIEVDRWTCDHYEGTQDGEKVQEVWAATLNELGISAEDLRSLADIADLFMTVGQPLPAFFRMGGDAPGGAGRFPGFPVMMVSYSNGQRNEKSEVADVRKEKLAATLFELPDSLTERKVPIGR
jgi:hypothetical protein